MRPVFLLGGAVFLLGCVTKAPESMLTELTQPVPASWSASKQAKSVTSCKCLPFCVGKQIYC